jgi:hypothetical protein
VIQQLRAEGSGPVVLIDHDDVATDDEISAALGAPTVVCRAADWFALRQAWERVGRHAEAGGPRPALVVTNPTVNTVRDLPYDIEQASVVRRVRIPGGADLEAAVLALDADTSERVVDRIRSQPSSASQALLMATADLPHAALADSPVDQFQVALRLHERLPPEAVLAVARRVLYDPLALALLADPPRIEELQEAWESWVESPADCPWADHFRKSGTEITNLLLGGALTPVLADGSGLPPWASLGVRTATPAERITALLEVRPPDATTFEGWARVAQWWGELRNNLAMVNPPDAAVSDAAWDVWEGLDDRFQAWLRKDYGSQLTRSWVNGPISLDKVQPFLATRRASGRRLLLIVLDGLGFAQWARVREGASLRVVRQGATLAMLPTLTEVSRQAIAAAALPSQFVESLGTTSKEAQRWASAWSGHAENPFWNRIDGTVVAELEAIPLGSVDVIGLVLSVTDKLIHAAEVLGDTAMHAGLAAWIDSGVLDELIARGSEHGYEMWITADHGNLECVPGPTPREGAFVERAGSRVRRYGSKSLRDEAAAAGQQWDNLPGFPVDEAARLLFAKGRAGWGSVRLAHGGLSLDEVVVPFVQVEAP